jgi:hypothetical protein
MTQASTRPPRLAVWLIELFVTDEQAPSVLGDLLEEFSDVAARSSVARARRWYWRQALPTILHLLISGFRAAPWFMAGVVAGGTALVELGWWFMGWSVTQGFNYLNHSVFPHIQPRSRFEVFLTVFLVNSGHYLYRLTLSMLIGCVVALLSKGREMSATLALSLICSIPALTRFSLFIRGAKLYGITDLFYVLLFFFGGLFALVAGGAIARSHRLRSLRATSS